MLPHHRPFDYSGSLSGRALLGDAVCFVVEMLFWLEHAQASILSSHGTHALAFGTCTSTFPANFPTPFPDDVDAKYKDLADVPSDSQSLDRPSLQQIFGAPHILANLPTSQGRRMHIECLVSHFRV